MVGAFSPQWICHNKISMKTGFLEEKKEGSVVVRLQGVANLMR
jgi:hypothetical protein